MSDDCNHIYPGCVCAESDLAEKDAEVAALRAEVARYKEREEHYAKALKVADGGQYRADWDDAIANVLASRDAALRAEVVELRALEMNHEGACVRLKAERDALAARLREAVGVVRRCEWDIVGPDDPGMCPVCANTREEGHTPDCALARVLAQEAK